METLYSKKNTSSSLFIAFAVFAMLLMCIYAMYFNTLGPVATLVMNFFNISNTEQGLIITIQSVGSILTAVYLSIQGERFNKITGALIGAALIVVSAFLIASTPARASSESAYSLILVFAAVGGIGMIMTGINVNGAVADIYPEKTRNTILTLIQAIYGAACMIIPIIVSATTFSDSPASFANPYFIIGAFGTACIMVFAIIGKRIKRYTVYSNMEELKTKAKKNPFEIYRKSSAWIILLISYLYFFFQIGLVTWFPTYSINDLNIDYGFSAFFNTAFFAGQLAMRFLLVYILRKMSPEKSFIIFGSIGALSMLLCLFMTDPVVIITLLVISGFFQGGGGTVTLLMATERFPGRSASAVSLNYLASGIAALTGPLIIGMIADSNGGSFRMSILVMIISLALSVLLTMLFSGASKKGR